MEFNLPFYSRLDRDHLRRQEEHSSYEIFRPGFIRLSIPFYSSIQEVEFISEAVKLVAQHGWKMLPLYMCNPETGEFHHHLNHVCENLLLINALNSLTVFSNCCRFFENFSD